MKTSILRFISEHMHWTHLYTPDLFKWQEGAQVLQQVLVEELLKDGHMLKEEAALSRVIMGEEGNFSCCN